ncbi:MAG: rhodanese-related sulfurtransferase [Oscillatoriophycideae cyanobacterium NC_groundwater_1537_Pr4_S-0.65um_50_18]|nr:rhodanese-related sulfurtransferase [Oscillatoriophycideae cyanobacterium NC_groundwater_1537_Pr4_S-0.65um_50_18]
MSTLPPLDPQISVEELARRITEPSLQLIDVREPEEVAIAQLQGFVNLPLSQFSDWAENIHSRFEADAETLVLCHHGMRSAQMCSWLHQQGFTRVRNISGGIEAYAAIVDPTIPRY